MSIPTFASAKPVAVTQNSVTLTYDHWKVSSVTFTNTSTGALRLTIRYKMIGTGPGSTEIDLNAPPVSYTVSDAMADSSLSTALTTLLTALFAESQTAGITP